MSTNRQSLPLAAALCALSQARLRNYRTFFSAGSDREAYGLYVWNEAVSNAFARALGAVEIVMRNQFHAALSLRYGAAGSPGSRDWFNHIELPSKSRNAVTELTHRRQRLGKNFQFVPRNPMPSPDDVVSKLTFGFWPHLLDVEADIHGNPIDWPNILVDALPGHRQRHPSFWSSRRNQDALFARIDYCNNLRNRIAHHEPIWKAGPLLEESRPRQNRRPLVTQRSPTTPAAAIARLGESYRRTLELLEWFSPEVGHMTRRSEAHHRFLALNSLAAVDDYRRHAGISRDEAIELTRYRKLRHLKAAFRNIRRTHGSASITYSGGRIGYFFASS